MAMVTDDQMRAAELPLHSYKVIIDFTYQLFFQLWNGHLIIVNCYVTATAVVSEKIISIHFSNVYLNKLKTSKNGSILTALKDMHKAESGP